jgi:DNA-binding transcriptional MerR regulator
MYKIGELSRLSQVPIRTLRYYDQIGILVPAQVDRSSGYRCYAAEQFERLNRILVFKDLGLTLDEIRTLLSDRASAEQIRALVQRRGTPTSSGASRPTGGGSRGRPRASR